VQAVIISPHCCSSKPQFSLCQSLPNWSLGMGSNNTKIWCECYVEWYRGAHNRFRGDNGQFNSQSSIGRVSLCVGANFEAQKLSDLVLTECS
jgi:hypothetical protein